MLKYIFCLLLGLSLTTMSASHLMGGEITVSVDSNNTGHFLLKLYRDMNGIPLGPSASVTITSPSGATMNISLSRTKTAVINGAYPTEANYYEGSTPLNLYGKFKVAYSTCCRNAGIVNLANSGGDAFYISTEFTSIQGLPNSTPELLNLPVTTFPIDSIWTYNPMPFDVDGDSLYWLIDTPLASVNQYVAGYTNPTANANGPLTMNSQTGEISWSADQLGNYQIAVMVYEYRNGQQIGYIARDMQVTVTSDTSAMSLVVPAVANPGGSLNLLANDPFSMDFNLSVADTSVSLSLDASGDPFKIPGSNAGFVVKKSASKTIVGTFSWTPDPTHVSTDPYRLVVRASDGNLSYDFTVLLNVPSSVGLSDQVLANNTLSIYPNPVEDQFTLSAEKLAAGMYTLVIFDATGRMVYEGQPEVWYQGRKLQLEGLNLENGMHILQLKGESQTYQQRLMIKK